MNPPRSIVIGSLLTLALGLCMGAGWAWMGEGTTTVEEPVSLESQEESEPSITESSITENPTQIGVNFIRVLLDDEPSAPGRAAPAYLDEPDWIFEDLEALGVQAVRQATEGDLFWSNVEPRDDAWNFEKTDAWLLDNPYEPIVTVFSMQYASATPPWETDPDAFQKTLNEEAKEYLDAVLERYADAVTYWEIGNEMDHWRIADPGEQAPPGASETPLSFPEDGFSPYEQGVFIAQVAETIRSKDPDAVIVLPGMSGLDTYLLDEWLTGVVEGGGIDSFDIVNYHYYGDHEGYPHARERLTETLKTLGIEDKPVWLTETGVTSDSTFTQRTDYPNSEQAQAADVFRRLIQAYAAGDELVLWHTHVSSSDAGASGDWRAYGLRTSRGDAKPAWFAFQLLTQTLIPFERVERVPTEESLFAYEVILREGEGPNYVVWGAGTFEVPEGITQQTSVAWEGNSPPWTTVVAGEQVELTSIPIVFTGK